MSWLLFSQLPKPRPSIIHRLQAPPSRVHLTVHRILQRSHAWPPSEAPRRRDTRAAPMCTHACIRGYLITRIKRTHTHDDFEKEDRRAYDTIRYGTQKIRDSDTRAWHVSRWINERGALLSSSSYLLLCAREICCGKCRYVDEGGSGPDCELCRYAPSSPAA